MIKIIDNSPLRNLALLIISQALLLGGASLLISTMALIGAQLGGANRATWTLTAYAAGSMASSFFAAKLMAKRGRKFGFVLGTVLGILGCIVAFGGMLLKSFFIVLIGVFFYGIYNAFAQQYRFAAAEAYPENTARAISWVLCGGVLGGALGPFISRFSEQVAWLDGAPAFTTTFIWAGGLCIIAYFSNSALRLPVNIVDEKSPEYEKSRISFKQTIQSIRIPLIFIAIVSAVVGYAVMNLLMGVTPLAMRLTNEGGVDINNILQSGVVICNKCFSQVDVAWVIQSHVVAMFLPGLITGVLIEHFGVIKIIFVGVLLNIACAWIIVMGTSFWHYWSALVFLGVGWNFMFIGGTQLLIKKVDVAKRAHMQGVNDTLIFAGLLISSLISAWLFNNLGWVVMAQIVLVIMFVVGCLIVYFSAFMKKK